MLTFRKKRDNLRTSSYQVLFINDLPWRTNFFHNTAFRFGFEEVESDFEQVFWQADTKN